MFPQTKSQPQEWRARWRLGLANQISQIIPEDPRDSRWGSQIIPMTGSQNGPNRPLGLTGGSGRGNLRLQTVYLLKSGASEKLTKGKEMREKIDSRKTAFVIWLLCFSEEKQGSREKCLLVSHVSLGFLCGSAGKKSACNVGDPDLLPWEDPLEKGKATHSRILAWRIPWTV